MNTRKTRREGNTLWVQWPDLTGQTLVSRHQLQPWIDALIDRTGPDGKPVEAVNFVFTDKACAAYNHDSLVFAKIGVYLNGDPPEAFKSKDGAPGFDARTDWD